jgi:serine/threonine-protein kinase
MQASAPLTPVESDGIREELARVTAFEGLQKSPRLRRFLEYVVGRTLDGQAAEIKEYVIGLDVFERGADFDPKTDGVVRDAARRLRAKLDEYYAGPRASNYVRIRLRKGGYVPEFEWTKVQAPEEELPPPAIPARVRFDWRLAAGAGIIVASIALTLLFVRLGQRPSPQSLFVQRFHSSDPRTQYLSDGLTEELQEGLSRIPELRVLVNAPPDALQTGESDYRSLGRKLGVAAILAGELTTQNGSLWVQYRLVRTEDGSLVAAGHRAAGTALVGIDDSIVADTARALRLKVPAIEPSTASQEAHDAYMRGRYLWHTRRPLNVLESIHLYERAIQIDPNFAGAYTGLADAYGVLVANAQMDPATGLPKGLAAAREAVARDPNSAEAHTALGLLHYSRWQWADAEREYRAAVELNPNYGVVYHRLAMLAFAFGRFAESERFYERGRVADPFLLSIPETEAQLYYYWRRPDKVIALCRHIEEISPGDDYVKESLARAYFEKGDFAAAYEEAKKWVSFSSADPNRLGTQAGNLEYLARVEGRAAAARLFAGVERQSAQGVYANPMDLAAGAMATGDRQKALRYLQSAYEQHITDLVSVRFDPFFDPLHGDPSFEKIFRDMGVTGELPK